MFKIHPPPRIYVLKYRAWALLALLLVALLSASLVQAQPSVTVTTKDITHNRASILINTSGGGNGGFFMVIVNTNPNNLCVDSTVWAGGGAPVHLHYRDLTPATTYHVTVRHSPRNGAYSTLHSTSFTTLAAPVFYQVLTGLHLHTANFADEMNRKITRLRWSGPPAGWDRKTFSYYHVEIYKLFGGRTKVHEAKTTEQSYDVPLILEEQRPHEAIVTLKRYDWGTRTTTSHDTQTLSFASPRQPGAPPVEPEPSQLPPIAFSVGIVNSTEATISWIAVSGATGYRLEYRGGDMSSGSHDLGAGTTEKRLTGLSPGVLYTVTLSANLPGGGKHSGQTSFTMPAAPTSTPIPQQQQIIGQGAPPDPPPQDNSPPELPDEAPPPQQQQQQQQPSTQGGLLGEVEAKIAHHRDNTGRADLVSAFSAARDALKGTGSVDAALAAATYQNALWDRIRTALNALAAQQATQNSEPPPPPQPTPVPPTPVPPTPIPPTPIPPTPIPPTPVPPPPPENQQPQVDADLLAEVEAKIVRHRDETGREDLEAGFTAVRDALRGDISPDEALAELKPGWNNDLWQRIRQALEALKG